MSYVVKRSPYCIITDDEDNYAEEHLAHHGVKGQKWGVIKENGTGSSSAGRSPIASASRSAINSAINTVSQAPKIAIAKKDSMTPVFSESSYSNSSGVFLPVKIKGSNTGIEFGIYGPELTSVIDQNKNVESYVRDMVMADVLRSKDRVFLTDKQIDFVVWRLMDEINHKWKKKYYTPKFGVSHSALKVIRSDDTLEHHGILGMKWGVRRYQNPDGTLTDAGRKHYGRNYTIHELKKNVQNAKTYEEKKAAVTANKVNRITKTPYRRAATTVATAGAGLASSGAMAGLMAAGLISVNPLLPVAALAGGVAAGKAINAGRDVVNMFRNLRAEQIDRKIDKQHLDKEVPQSAQDKEEKRRKKKQKLMNSAFLHQTQNDLFRQHVNNITVENANRIAAENNAFFNDTVLMNQQINNINTQQMHNMW